MKTSHEVTNKSAALALDFHLKDIDWNLRTMMGQADVLETALIEMKQTVYSGTKQNSPNMVHRR
jgi:hypothetical protein